METTMEMYSPVTIANYFIKKSIEEGVEMTPMKVLKLVYIAHGWHLGLFDEELISEQVQAWKYGPVVRSVYQEFKHYGNRDIEGLSFKSTFEKEEFGQLKEKGVYHLLDKIWEVYKDYTGLQLSTLTHQPGTPWYQIWEEKRGKLSGTEIIPNDLIKGHYEKKARRSGDQ